MVKKNPNIIKLDFSIYFMIKGKIQEEKWKKKLTPEQYYILREKGTEPAFSGKYWNEKSHGMYKCAACGQQLFSSSAKFDSGTGWPSFTDVLPGSVEFHEDNTLFMKRIEVICSKCKSHLGHIFNNGKEKGGKRFCINSCSLDFKKIK